MGNGKDTRIREKFQSEKLVDKIGIGEKILNWEMDGKNFKFKTGEKAGMHFSGLQKNVWSKNWREKFQSENTGGGILLIVKNLKL